MLKKLILNIKNCKLGKATSKFDKHKLIVLIHSYDCEIYITR